MFKIEDFVHYSGQPVSDDMAVLTWCRAVGYQFMFESERTTQEIVGIRL